MQPLELRPERVDTATKVFMEKVKLLNDPEGVTMLIIHELGLWEHMTFDDEGRFQFDLTDVQWVALAAATAAVCEVGGYVSPTPNQRQRLHIWAERVEYAEVVNASANV